MASNMGAQKARAMKSGTGSFDVDQFIIKLRNFMNGGLKSETILAEDGVEDSEYVVETSKLDWDRIGRLALAKSRRAPALTFMSVVDFSFPGSRSYAILGLALFPLNRRFATSTSVLDNQRGM
jgi:hypothetical protein